jgi:hypothetical protein
MLAGCGGGGSDNENANTTAPPATTAPAAAAPDATPDAAPDQVPSIPANVEDMAGSIPMPNTQPAADRAGDTAPASEADKARATAIMTEVSKLFGQAEASLRSVSDVESAQMAADDIVDIFDQMTDLRDEFLALAIPAGEREYIKDQSDFGSASQAFAFAIVPIAQGQPKEVMDIVRDAMAGMPRFAP